MSNLTPEQLHSILGATIMITFIICGTIAVIVEIIYSKK